jgi:hypothetical protein
LPTRRISLQPRDRAGEEGDGHVHPPQRRVRGVAAEPEPRQRKNASGWSDRIVSIVRPRGGGEVKTARERAEEKRAEKLEQVREQVESGSLVIREMTEDERRRYPPPQSPPKRPGRR